jgi:hypothetical protein
LLIEQTSKTWKLIQLIGGAILLLGVVLLVVPMTKKGDIVLKDQMPGIVVSAIGLITYGVGKMAAWWHHG